jgi:hypothetical protein
VPDAASSLCAIDPKSPWIIALGRGSGLDGLDGVTIASDGTATLYRMTWNSQRMRIWETTTMTLPQDSILRVLAAASDNRLFDLSKMYHATVYDGSQWVFFATQGAVEKAVYFNNHFPSPIVRFSESLDDELVRNGVFSAAWRQESETEAREFQKQFWDRIKR